MSFTISVKSRTVAIWLALGVVITILSLFAVTRYMGRVLGQM